MAVIGNATALRRNNKAISQKNKSANTKKRAAVNAKSLPRLNSSAIAVILLVALLFSTVIMTAHAAALKTENNKIEQQNEYLAAEIDSINNDITDETTLDKIEKTASKKYGMIYPNSSNYITIKDNEPIEGNLADAIREEVYG